MLSYYFRPEVHKNLEFAEFITIVSLRPVPSFKMPRQGKLNYTDGRKYVGEFKDGEMDGQGTFTNKSGTKFVGEYKDGKKWNGNQYDKNGKIIKILSDGNTYLGEVKNGIPNGKGILFFLDGRLYVGDWKNGYKHGQGTFTYSDGEKYVGEWKDGREWDGTFYDKNGNISQKRM